MYLREPFIKSSMKSFACIVLVLVAFTATSLAVKCTVGNKIIAPGQSIDHPDSDVPCVKLTCREDGSTDCLSCATPALTEGCKDEGYENPNLPYPQCCKRIITCDYKQKGK